MEKNMSMLRMLIKVFSRKRKAYVTPPIWPYNVKPKKIKTKKVKITGEWEIPQ
jgi:hypothetical protein